ncbi:MAG: hypothetical protein E6Q83_10700 [Thiothrix sp.]|nr:MAG: hypothetical protein E6Q83_10700 [Thiothrix sp.]
MTPFQQQRLSLSFSGLLLAFCLVHPSLADNTATSSATATTSLAETLSSAKDEVFIQQLITTGIRPLYRDLEQASQQLTQASTDFCQNSSLEQFQKLRDAWGTSMLAWQRTDSLLFGPATAEQMDFQINFAPPKKQIIKGLLASDKPISTEVVAAAGVGAQGLSSLEYVLFDREQTTEQLLTSFKDASGQTRCSYIQAVSSLLEQNIKKLNAAWLSPDADQQFTNNQEVIDLLIGKAYQSLERINLKKLTQPLGNLDEKKASYPYDLEAWRSGYSFKIIKANIEGLQQVFVKGGFLAWIDKNFPSEATKTAVVSFEKQVQDLVQMKLPEVDPFTLVAQKQVSAELNELVQRTRGLEMGLKRQLAVLAKAQLGFNDNDGD